MKMPHGGLQRVNAGLWGTCLLAASRERNGVHRMGDERVTVSVKWGMGRKD